MNQASENRLSKVHPELARRVRALVSRLSQAGLRVEVVQGLRTWDEQAALFAQGRETLTVVNSLRRKAGLAPLSADENRRRVTDARAGQSNHNYGLACDLCPFKGNVPDWNAPAAVWKQIGAAAKAAGLKWGGDWQRPDRPHVELPGLTLPECRALYVKGGLPLVWAEAERKLPK
jgi:peptidoglycan LD-endopeptidase CwlK